MREREKADPSQEDKGLQMAGVWVGGWERGEMGARGAGRGRLMEAPVGRIQQGAWILLCRSWGNVLGKWGSCEIRVVLAK